MKTERFSCPINGTDCLLEVRYDKMPYRAHILVRQFHISVFQAQWFAVWDKTRRCTVVDVNAPRWYVRLAALCDAVDKQSLYADLLDRELPPQGDAGRRLAVEQFLLGVAGRNYRAGYTAARRVLYDGLLRTGMYDPDEEASMRIVADWFRSVSA